MGHDDTGRDKGYPDRARAARMDPEPADGWPDRPLSTDEARALLTDDVTAVWVMDHDETVTRAVLDGMDDDAVIDVVLETAEKYHLYSFTDYEGDAQWVEYEPERKGTEGGETMTETLKSYRLLAGTSEGANS